MKFLTAHKGEPHLTSAQFRNIIESLVGDGSYIAEIDEQMEVELAENNTVKIRSGCLIHHGGVFEISRGTYDTVTYTNGAQGQKRIDLIVARYTKNADTSVENSEWRLIKGTPTTGTPTAPDYVHGNMQDGDLVDECPFVELHFNGVAVTEVVPRVTISKTIKYLTDSVAELNSKFTNYQKQTLWSITNQIIQAHKETYTATKPCIVFCQSSLQVGGNLGARCDLYISHNSKNISSDTAPKSSYPCASCFAIAKLEVGDKISFDYWSDSSLTLSRCEFAMHILEL